MSSNRDLDGDMKSLIHSKACLWFVVARVVIAESFNLIETRSWNIIIIIV